jgi:hypothetical protein
MWISLNVVDGSPDGLITVSSLVAFRIYILSNYMGRFLLAEAQELNKNLPILGRVPHGLVAEVVDQRENDRVCGGNGPLGATRRKAQEDTRCKQEEENGNEEAHPDVHGYTLSLDFLTAALRPKGPVLFYHRTRWNG